MKCCLLSMMVCYAAATLCTATAALRTTTQDGYWTNQSTWTGDLLPAPDDIVEINHDVILDESTPLLIAFTNHATLTFHGWNTQLKAAHVTINGTVTHPIQSAITTVGGVWIPDNRIWIVCSNLTLNAGISINADFAGWQKGQGAEGNGCGPGGGLGDTWASSGGGHGGRGSRSNGSNVKAPGGARPTGQRLPLNRRAAAEEHRSRWADTAGARFG